MRVIAGQARGRRLVAPSGDRVRPTLDRVREALFNILAPRMEGASFLDLFAGSGANGIEALSRGAVSAVFVDDHPQSLACVRQNLETTQFTEHAQCVRCRLPEGLARISGVFDIVFADPPYEFTEHETLIQGIVAARLLKAGGVLVLEHTYKASIPESVSGLSQTQTRRYGTANLSFYA